MKKIQLKLEGMHMLTKEQMKSINGGGAIVCWALSGYGSEGTNTWHSFEGENLHSCNDAQWAANNYAQTSEGYYLAPWGFDCECGY